MSARRRLRWPVLLFAASWLAILGLGLVIALGSGEAEAPPSPARANASTAAP